MKSKQKKGPSVWTGPLSLRGDIMGLFDKLFKTASSPPSVTYEGADGYTISITVSLNSVYIRRGFEECFDGFIMAERNGYYLSNGFINLEDAFAVFTKERLVVSKKTDEGAVGFVLLPSGTGVIFTDEDHVLILSAAGAVKKQFSYYSADTIGRILTDDFCAYVEDCDDYVLLKCMVFDTMSIWSKKIKVVKDRNNPVGEKLELFDNVFVVTSTDGTVHRFTVQGAVI